MVPLVRLSQRAIVQCLFRSRQQVWLCRGFCVDGHGADGKTSVNGHEGWDFRGIDPNAFIGGPSDSDEDEREEDFEMCPRKRLLKEVKIQADWVFQVLQQDDLGFDFRSKLESMQVKVSSLLVREVLWRILTSVNDCNKSQSARLALKFFAWSGQQDNFKHNANVYNLVLKIFYECKAFTAMWRLVDEMNRNGLPTTTRTLTMLISTCRLAGTRRKMVKDFVKFKNFNFRPFKNSFTAVLYSLVCIRQYRMIEWVYRQMKNDGHDADVLTYNILLWTKYRLNKMTEFFRLLDQMLRNGLAPDLHTYNVILHMLGRRNSPDKAIYMLNYMDTVGCRPRVIHYTSLIDGLSRAGNLEASREIYDMMVQNGCEPDVVCYTVMITGHVVAGEPEKAHQIFDDMITKGHLPNVFTYNSMIRGLCEASKFTEALSMLKEMENKGCIPNFTLYNAVVRRMGNAGKISEAQEIIKNMVEKGRYMHLLQRFSNIMKKNPSKKTHL